MEHGFEYEQPRIEDFGDLAEITASGSQSGNLDGNYAPGTPNSTGGGLFS